MRLGHLPDDVAFDYAVGVGPVPEGKGRVVLATRSPLIRKRRRGSIIRIEPKRTGGFRAALINGHGTWSFPQLEELLYVI